MTGQERWETYSKWVEELNADEKALPDPIPRYVCVEADHRGGTWLTFRDSIGEACKYLSESAKEGGYWPEFIIDLDEDMKRSVVVEVIVTPEEEQIVPVLMRQEEIRELAAYLRTKPIGPRMASAKRILAASDKL